MLGTGPSIRAQVGLREPPSTGVADALAFRRRRLDRQGMLPTRALPAHLLVGAHGRDHLARHGVSDHELRGPLWSRTCQGLWAWAPGGSPSDDARQRIARAAPLAGDRGAIGGWAAAFMHGFVELDGVTHGDRRLPVPLCLPRGVQCRRRDDVQVTRSDLAAHEVVKIDGIRVTSLVRTCADLARLGHDIGEAVTSLDVIVRDGDRCLGLVARWLEEHRGWRGVARARRVIDLVRAGTESPQESRLRMLWVIEAGLPMPLVNQWLYTPGERLLGRADLIDPAAGLVGEYDGKEHSGADRRSRDHRRRESFERAGLIVVQHTMADLGAQRRMAVARLRGAHARGSARSRPGDAWVIGPAPSWARRPRPRSRPEGW